MFYLAVSPDSVRSAISAIMNHLGSLFANYMGSEQPHVCADYADINLVDAIKRVSGVGDVKNFTAQDYSIRVWLQPKQDRCAWHYA